MKTVAITDVIFPRNVAGPLLPKTVWLEPPNAAPISEPLPDCKRTIKINRIHIAI